MPVTRWAISLEESLARAIKRSAAREPISAWLADAARKKLRTQGLRQVVDAWEGEHGAFTDAELQAARKELESHLQPRRPRARVRKR